MASERTALPCVDLAIATAPRMYDYFLDGQDNFAVDRIGALKVIEPRQTSRRSVSANRGFLGRAVRYLATEAGMSHFLDLGTGLPMPGNVHQQVQAAKEVKAATPVRPVPVAANRRADPRHVRRHRTDGPRAGTSRPLAARRARVG